MYTRVNRKKLLKRTCDSNNRFYLHLISTWRL